MSDIAGDVAGIVADILPKLLPEILPGLVGQRERRYFQGWIGPSGGDGAGDEGYDIAEIVAGDIAAVLIVCVFAVRKSLLEGGLAAILAAFKRESGIAVFVAGGVADPDGRWGWGIRGVCGCGHGVVSMFHGGRDSLTPSGDECLVTVCQRFAIRYVRG